MRHEFYNEVCLHCSKNKKLVRGDEICPTLVGQALGANIIAKAGSEYMLSTATELDDRGVLQVALNEIHLAEHVLDDSDNPTSIILATELLRLQGAVDLAIGRAINGGFCDGGHHKQHSLDQVIRILYGPGEYEKWRKAIAEDSEYWPEWDEGIP